MGKEMKINWKRLNGVMITWHAGGGRVRRIIFSELFNWLQVNLSKILISTFFYRMRSSTFLVIYSNYLAYFLLTLIFPLLAALFDFHTHCFQLVCGTTLAWLALALSPFSPLSPFLPGFPTMPRSPFIPTIPVSPFMPFIPGGPLFPGSPSRPLSPLGPGIPCDPLSPICPFVPSLPWGPCGPGTPGIPGMPFDPGMPGNPWPSINFCKLRWIY